MHTDAISSYCRLLSPGLIRMALLLRGMEMPSASTPQEPLRYLELGYGQGISLNIHAAAAPGRYWGTDINPDHTIQAQALGNAAGAGLLTYNLSFAELASRMGRQEDVAHDLPECDIIVLHDVWCGLNDENRRAVLDIINRKLKMGGVLYVGYNTLPGWAGLLPLRDLLSMHAGLAGADADHSLQRMGDAVNFARNLEQTQAGYFSANPMAGEALTAIMHQDARSVTHEFFNRTWKPGYFFELAHTLEYIKLSFAGSAHLLFQLDALTMPADAQELTRTMTNVPLREMVRDVCLNRRFRSDLFVKGARRLHPQEHLDALSRLRMTLTVAVEHLPMEIPGPSGMLTLNAAIYGPVVTVLAEHDYAPKTLEQLEDHPALKALDSAQLLEVLTVLTGAGLAHPAQDDASIEAARPACARLNATLCRRARTSGDISVLASPVLGAGLGVSRLEQLFLLSQAQGESSPDAWGEDADNILCAQGERLMRDATPLEPAAMREELVAMARRFSTERLDFLTAMGILPSSVG